MDIEITKKVVKEICDKYGIETRIKSKGEEEND